MPGYRILCGTDNKPPGLNEISSGSSYSPTQYLLPPSIALENTIEKAAEEVGVGK